MCKHPVVETARLISSLVQLYSIQYNQASVVRINTENKQHVCVANVSMYLVHCIAVQVEMPPALSSYTSSRLCV